MSRADSRKVIQHNHELLALLRSFSNRGYALTRHTFAPGQQLFRQDEKPGGVYIIVRGWAKCYITEENGRCFVVEFLGEGEILGELELLTGESVLNHVEAVAELDAYRLTPAVFEQLLQEQSEFSRLLLRVLATRVRRTSRRASYQQVYPLEYAVLQALGNQPAALTKQDLADYLGVPIRSLNRTLRHLAKNGLFVHGATKKLAVHPERLQVLLRAYR